MNACSYLVNYAHHFELVYLPVLFVIILMSKLRWRSKFSTSSSIIPMCASLLYGLYVHLETLSYEGMGSHFQWTLVKIVAEGILMTLGLIAWDIVSPIVSCLKEKKKGSPSRGSGQIQNTPPSR